MDLRKLKKLIDLVEESGIAEIEVTEGEEKVRITRSVAAPAVQTVYAPAAPVQAAPVAAAPAPSAAPPRLHPPLRRAICPTRKNRRWLVLSTARPARLLRPLSKSAKPLKPATPCALSRR